jgi:predicted O-methyltransferase YrrM
VGFPSVKRWVVGQVPGPARHALYRIYRQLYWLYRRAATAITRQGWPPGHHYSPVVDVGYVRRHSARLFNTRADLGPGIDLNEPLQEEMLAAVASFYPDFDWPEQPAPGRRYYLNNRLFIYGDAAVLYGLLRRFLPRRVVEVGSGFSSALMLDTVERHAELDETELVFIEPYSARLQTLLGAKAKAHHRVVEALVQDVPLSEFARLEAGDFLFIDSSHVAKTGSGVNFLVFDVLPILRPGVIVHVHDILWPFEYPQRWVVDLRWSWNEAYLVRAFLTFNAAFEIVLFNSYMGETHRSFLEQRMPLALKYPGASLWLRRR